MTLNLFNFIMDTLWISILGGILISAILTILDYLMVKLLIKNSEFTTMSYILGGLLMVILPNLIIPMFLASKIKRIIESGVDIGQNVINGIPVIGEFVKVDDYVKTNVLGLSEIDSYIVTRVIICLTLLVIVGVIIAKTMTSENGNSRVNYGDSLKCHNRNYGTRYTTGGVDEF